MTDSPGYASSETAVDGSKPSSPSARTRRRPSSRRSIKAKATRTGLLTATSLYDLAERVFYPPFALVLYGFYVLYQKILHLLFVTVSLSHADTSGSIGADPLVLLYSPAVRT